MINLYNSVKNSSLPSSCLFCHHRLSIDFDELFNEKLRMSSNKCYTKIDTPIFKDGNYVINCQIQSTEGFYKDIIFKIKIFISKEYPFVSPRIISNTKIVHPNIHVDTGEVSIAMLKQSDWIPVLNLNFILFALELLIIQPNIHCTPEHPPNQELVRIYQRDLELFEALIGESKAQLTLQPSLEEEKETFSNLEKQLSEVKVTENFMQKENIKRSLVYDFEKYEPRKKEVHRELKENFVMEFETVTTGSKKRPREEESLINPFLKKVRISPA